MVAEKLMVLLVVSLAVAYVQPSTLDVCFPDPGDRTAFEGCECFDVGDGTCEGGRYGMQVTCEGEAAVALSTSFPRLNETYPGITCLEFERVQFMELNKTDLTPFPNLRQLEIIDGGLARIYSQTFDATPKLSRLTLQRNRLTAFPDVVQLLELEHLLLDDNLILTLEHEDIARLSSLRVISMDNNNLNILKNGVFKGLNCLQVVRMSGNNELSVEDETFLISEGITDCHGSDIYGIQRLDLSYTAIDRMPYRGLREGLIRLKLDGTRDLKYFDAQMPGVTTEAFYRNLTFPILESVSFHYSALCCQFRSLSFLDIHGVSFSQEDLNDCYDPPIANSGTDSVSSSGMDNMPSNGTDSMSNDSVTVVCYNTSMCPWGVVNETNYNMSLSAEKFCASVPTSCCSIDVCPGGCGSNNSSLLSDDIVCMQINPTKCYNETFPVNKMEENCTNSNCTSTSLMCKSSVACIPSSNIASSFPSPTPSPTSPPLPCPPQINRCSADYCEQKVDCINNVNANREDEVRACDLCRIFPCDRDVLNCGRDGLWGNCECEDPDRKRSLLNQELRQVRATQPSDPPPEGWFYLHDNDSVICMEVPSPTPEPTPKQECVYQVILQHASFSDESTACTPKDDPFNPCEDLLGSSNHALRVLIWPVIIVALLGNGLVIFVIVGYVFVMRRTKMDSFIMHFLYLNLAVADFMMGLYLFTLSVVDLDTVGRFSLRDVQWRTGPGCSFAGFLAITSTVASVFTLVVITIERVYTIMNVMHTRKISRLVIYAVVVAGWCMAVLMGIFPLVGISDYSVVSICLPFDVSTDIAKAYVTFILVSTGLAFLTILICYALIFYEVFCSRTKRKLHSVSLRKTWKTEIKVGLRMGLLVFTNIAAWFPIAFLALTAVYGSPLLTNTSAAKFLVVFILPINSCLNPVLYSLSTKVFRQNFCLLLYRFGLFKKYNKRMQSKRAGYYTPSTSSAQRSVGSGGRRDTIVSRLLSFSNFSSITSDSNLRRSSVMSQNSVEDNRLSLGGRRASALSTTSSDDPAMYRMIGRRSSNLSDSSSEETQHVTFVNVNFRDGSPTGQNESEREREVASKSKRKISSSNILGLPDLPEEIENESPVKLDTSLVQQNPAFLEREEEEEEGDNGMQRGDLEKEEEEEEGYFTDIKRDSKNGIGQHPGDRVKFADFTRHQTVTVDSGESSATGSSCEEGIELTEIKLGPQEHNTVNADTESMVEVIVFDS